MKISLSRVLPSLAVLLSLAFFSGCATSPSLSPPSPEQGAAALRDTVSMGSLLVLRNNPDYLPAVQAVAAAVDGFLLASTNDEITQQQIDDFVKGIAERNGVMPEDVPLFLNITHRFCRLYQDTYHVDVIHRLDPGVALWVSAVKDGVADALAAINSAHR